MTGLEPEELLKLARAAVKACPAEAAEATADGESLGQIRLAGGGVTTSGSVDRVTLTVRAFVGQKSASATTEDVSPDGVTRAARVAADLARLSPASPEVMGVAPPQVFAKTFSWDPATAAGTPDSRAALAKAILGAAKDNALVAAAYLEERASSSAIANSAGLAGMWRGTSVDVSTTFRTGDGRQSGWAGATAIKASDIDGAALGKRAAQKALAWRDPIELPPGRYTAVLEPAAVAPLLENLYGALDRRNADEGQSCFSAPGGTTKIGEMLFAPPLSLIADPADKKIPGRPWGESGLAAAKISAVEKGKLALLPVSRYWAKQSKLKATPTSGNWSLLHDKPEKDLDALLAGVERGVLVTRIWYVRMLSPQTLSVTGLTRDATFLIEDGRISSPIKNFRLNQGVLEMLANTEAAGPTELNGGYGVPALRVKEFGFSSLSDAV